MRPSADLFNEIQRRIRSELTAAWIDALALKEMPENVKTPIEADSKDTPTPHPKTSPAAAARAADAKENKFGGAAQSAPPKLGEAFFERGGSMTKQAQTFERYKKEFAYRLEEFLLKKERLNGLYVEIDERNQIIIVYLHGENVTGNMITNSLKKLAPADQNFPEAQHSATHRKIVLTDDYCLRLEEGLNLEYPKP